MRITFVSPAVDLSGGFRVVVTYAERLRRRGHDVTILAPTERAGWRSWLRSDRARLRPSHLDGLDLRVVRFDPSAAGLERAAPAADAIVATWWLTAEWVSALSRAKGTPVYFIQHHEVFPYLPVDRVRATYQLPIGKIVIAKWLQDLMASEYGDTAARLVSNSVDHDVFFAAPRPRQPRPTAGLLYSSIAWKRFDVALDALARVRQHMPDLSVRSFGSEKPERPLPDWVSFSQSPPQSTIRELYAACDLWVTASSSEGFNLPAMEAMACGTPVVATRTGWPAEAITDAVNGYCVPVDDADALEAAIERVLRLDDAAWRTMSAAAFATVRNSHWDRSADRFERAIVDLVTETGVTPRLRD